MLYNYKEVISLFGNDYNLKKAILAKQIFKIEKGIYSDGENNFTVTVFRTYINSAHRNPLSL